MEQLLALDRELMVQLNLSGSHNVFLDGFMWMSSMIVVWLPVILMLIYILYKTKGKQALWIVLAIAIVFLLCDQISSSLLKPYVARLRPSHDPLVMDMLEYVRDYHGGQFGFPSSHAANSFGFATFSALLFRNRLYTFAALLWAAVCAYSRIYLGVHFPGDILVGTLLGISVGFFCYFCYRRFFGEPFRTPNSVFTESGFLRKDLNILVSLLMGTFAVFAILSLTPAWA
ncbi:MAG: phosphatase PAP2 family protein [Paludibacteraceae bacterium]|nr:phosphatase PAP2 family protein [Paludibacteraceae bacterium]